MEKILSDVEVGVLGDRLEGLIFDIKRFASDDGPGIRTTVFFKGCPLNCIWCHSPESISRQPELVFYESRCIKCGKCVAVCAYQAQYFTEKGKRKIDRTKCQTCGKCCEACYAGALEMKGNYLGVKEIYDEIEKDVIFFVNSGGGVTLSGGEPTLQSAFVVSLLRKLKKNGIHTALDTCGFVKWEILEELVPYVDLFLYDIKHMDAEKHIEYTGVSNQLILENLEKLAGAGKEILLRVPLVPGYNDSETNIVSIVRCAKKLHLGEIDFLPYNEIAEAKYEWVGKSYALEHLKGCKNEKLGKIEKIAETKGLKIKIGR